VLLEHAHDEYGMSVVELVGFLFVAIFFVSFCLVVLVSFCSRVKRDFEYTYLFLHGISGAKPETQRYVLIVVFELRFRFLYNVLDGHGPLLGS
jgi:hypothetical protein